MPQVSVIIPTYNRSALVCDAIGSVLAQNVQDFEIIVADDGSTDDTAAAVARFGNKVRYLALRHRGQPAAARNAGLAVASGDYVAFLDSDDLFLPDKLARQLPVLEADATIGLVYSNGYYFDQTPSETSGSALDGLPSPSGDVFGALLRGNFIMTPALTLIRRTLLEAAGGFDENPALIAVEDYDLWLHLSLAAKIQFVPGYVALIRRHPNNLSTNILRHRQHILTVYKKLEQEQPAAIAANATACHEGQARDHAGIAILALQQHLWGLALRHGATALWHTVHLPGLGLEMMREWRYRSRQRSITQ